VFGPPENCPVAPPMDVTEVSISLILSFIRRSNSLGVALLSVHNSTNKLPLYAIHVLIDLGLSRGFSKVLFGLYIPLPYLTLLSQLSPSLIPSTRCKMGSGV
jgi:hypothetical protein